jgi:cytoskeletal protein CcmA (bactofilin family)/ribosomal protein S27E
VAKKGPSKANHGKISVECPHCGNPQMEPASAKSTYCRKCSRHIDLEKTQASGPPEAKRSFFIKKIEALLGQDTARIVRCHKCEATQQVDGLAKSVICAECNTHMDLRDFKISSLHSCNIHTQGFVEVTAKGELNCQKVICSEAIIEGQVHGMVICDTVRMKYKGMLFCGIEAEQLIVEKGADAELSRPVKVATAQINGRFSARIMAEGIVSVGKTGWLEGTVYARSINIEQGGVFQGELFIGQKELSQAELLPLETQNTKIIELNKRNPGAYRQAG